MKQNATWCKTILSENNGQDVVEYALLVTLVALGAIVSVRGLSSVLSWLGYIGASIISSV